MEHGENCTGQTNEKLAKPVQGKEAIKNKELTKTKRTSVYLLFPKYEVILEAWQKKGFFCHALVPHTPGRNLTPNVDLTDIQT